MYVILVYDIKNDGNFSFVSRNVFKTCKKFLTHIQNSVFEGNLDKAQHMDLGLQLKKYLRNNIDSCIMFFSNNDKWLQKDFLTDADDKTDNMI